jgi:hypothetical protein
MFLHLDCHPWELLNSTNLCPLSPILPPMHLTAGPAALWIGTGLASYLPSSMPLNPLLVATPCGVLSHPSTPRPVMGHAPDPHMPWHHYRNMPSASYAPMPAMRRSILHGGPSYASRILPHPMPQTLICLGTTTVICLPHPMPQCRPCDAPYCMGDPHMHRGSFRILCPRPSYALAPLP